MERRDEYDDDEDDRAAKPPRGGLPPALVVLLAVGGGFLSLAAVAGVGFLMVAGSRTVETRPTQTEPVGKLYTRDEFRKLVVGKTADEVLKAIGKPESTSDYGDGEPTWRYKEITTDPVSGRTDSSVTVWFGRSKRVFNVTY